MASATVDSPLGFDRPVSTAYTHIYQSPLLLWEEGAKPAARPVSVFLGAFLVRLTHPSASRFAPFLPADEKPLHGSRRALDRGQRQGNPQEANDQSAWQAPECGY